MRSFFSLWPPFALKKGGENFLLAIFFIFVGAFLRVVPHLPNFTPISAMAIFAGANIDKRYSLIIALLALVLSDYLLLYINPYNTPIVNFSRFYPVTEMFHSTTLFVWGSIIVSGLIGIWVKSRQNPKFLIGASLFASIQFFLITNFGVWASGYYPPGLEGLMESYMMGLPFLKWTILGDLFYTAGFFGLYKLALRFDQKSFIDLIKKLP